MSHVASLAAVDYRRRQTVLINFNQPTHGEEWIELATD